MGLATAPPYSLPPQSAHLPMNTQARTDTAYLAAVLTRQNDLLQAILATLSKPELGLLETTPGTTRIYCNRDRCPGALWYCLDGTREPIPLTAKAIKGYLTSLKFEEVQRRGKPSWKLYTTLDCGDRSYELESGSEAVFSKGILAAIASLTPLELQQPISIGVMPGDDESVLLSRVWLNDSSPVFVKWDEISDWREISKRAIANVTASRAVQ